MKKYFAFVLITAMASAMVSCTKDRISGSGPVSSENRNLSNFSKIYINGSTAVNITQGNDFEIEVTAYSNLLPYLETKVSNGSLTIGYKENTNIRNDNSVVNITMPMIEGLTINGSSDIEAAGNFSGSNEIIISINGSGNINFQEGSTDFLKVNIAGSGDFGGFGLTADEAEVSISGSGNVSLTVLQKLDATIRGSGNVNYKGSPTEVNTDISGSGKVTKK